MRRGGRAVQHPWLGTPLPKSVAVSVVAARAVGRSVASSLSSGVLTTAASARESAHGLALSMSSSVLTTVAATARPRAAGPTAAVPTNASITVTSAHAAAGRPSSLLTAATTHVLTSTVMVTGGGSRRGGRLAPRTQSSRALLGTQGPPPPAPGNVTLAVASATARATSPAPAVLWTAATVAPPHGTVQARAGTPTAVSLNTGPTVQASAGRLEARTPAPSVTVSYSVASTSSRSEARSASPSARVSRTVVAESARAVGSARSLTSVGPAAITAPARAGARAGAIATSGDSLSGVHAATQARSSSPTTTVDELVVSSPARVVSPTPRSSTSVSYSSTSSSARAKTLGTHPSIAPTVISTAARSLGRGATGGASLTGHSPVVTPTHAAAMAPVIGFSTEVVTPAAVASARARAFTGTLPSSVVPTSAGALARGAAGVVTVLANPGSVVPRVTVLATVTATEQTP